jgi:hypothetical protein
MTAPESEDNAAPQNQSINRRGVVAAAWAAVLGLILGRTEQPVEAAAGLQFQDASSATNVNNAAGGSTSITASTGYQSDRAVFSALAGSGSSRVGLGGAYGNAFLVGTEPCGVLGYNITGTAGPGVQGIDFYSTRAGVLGLSGGTGNGSGVGVQGESGSGIGVRGQISPASTQSAIGVYGLNYSSYTGPGPGAGGFAVYGLSAKGHGLVGATATAGGAAVVGATNGVANAFAGAFYGPVIIGGDFTVYGAKSAAVPHPDGSRRRVYCMESPDSWFEDFGKATLACGRAEVTIDPDFAAIVDLTDYHVFLTGYDIDHPLRVTDQTANGFTVEAPRGTAAAVTTDRELAGRFSWRIVAKRKDIDARRLEPVTMPPHPELPDFPPAS